MSQMRLSITTEPSPEKNTPPEVRISFDPREDGNVEVALHSVGFTDSGALSRALRAVADAIPGEESGRRFRPRPL